MTAPIRVLIVDDDRGARALHGAFVAETPGFVVAGSAATGEEASAQATRGFDLILLDMRLPDISGIEVLHRLRTLGEASPDVLVISSSQDQTTVRQAMSAHVIGYLLKPFTQAALQERLERYRASRRTRVDAGRQRPFLQSEIDRLLATGGIGTRDDRAHPPERQPTDGHRLPKGLAEPTLERVVTALDPVTAQSARQIADACELSAGTAHRYLTYLVDAGVIDVAHRYGKRGRPEIMYRLAPSIPSWMSSTIRR
ncbi:MULTISPECIES: response regulator [Microbacterium]|uniref:Transcriptional regulatory protein DcuR n=1 Tax=Microbacterium oxydans TaxID=82380 RepID=A0A3S9WG89_9MICO|nr:MULTISPECIES: response regulator [Microbacterium]AZS38937.1 Transcriptional regulatory protein DcuR [Microbacterium oxydans]KKX98062.1 response regulator of citrate/malate metabolism [Microbacterium sp. Ag1]